MPACLRDFRDLAMADGRIDLLGGDGMVLARADPGLGRRALTGIAKLIQQIVETAGDEVPAVAPAARAAELAVGQIIEHSAERAREGRRQPDACAPDVGCGADWSACAGVFFASAKHMAEDQGAGRDHQRLDEIIARHRFFDGLVEIEPLFPPR